MTTYATRAEAIQREIIDPIEANGTDIARAEDYDIDAIADEVLGDYADGYELKVDLDEFWRIVERHAHPRVLVGGEWVNTGDAAAIARLVSREVPDAGHPATHPTGEWHEVHAGPALLAIGGDDDGVSWAIYRNADDDEELSSGGWTYDEPDAARRQIALIIETLTRLGAEEE